MRNAIVHTAFMAAEANPFRYGDLALDEAFTDREDELAALEADCLAGQNVVLFAPRRFGKSSLVWKAAQRLTRQGVLVAQVDLMRTPTKERFAEHLARAIHDDIAGALFRAKERLAVFRGLRVAPVITIDPDDASVGFSFDAGHRSQDIDATIERLLELPAQLGADRGRRVVLVFDEFQEVTRIDPGLPSLMRSIFQQQPEVAHVYLGSKRHLLERLFHDENEPFWRSAKQMELGVIPAELFVPYIRTRFRATGKAIDARGAAWVLEHTGGHPYATQELCSFVWQAGAAGAVIAESTLEDGLVSLLRSENARFTNVWESASRGQRVLLQALATGPGRPLAADFRRRHGLAGPSSVQRALAALVADELVGPGESGEHRIVEPFLAAWIARFAS